MEYEFRGKRVDNGEWVYGNLVIDTDGGQPYIVECAYWNCEESSDQTLYYPVDRATIGQFTGYRTTDEAKVFDKDIIQRHEIETVEGHSIDYGTCTAEVFWEEDEGRWSVRETVSGEVYPLYEFYFYHVIGNTVDNPELLEAKS